MSKSDQGTAVLDVSGRRISITLKPREQQKRMPIPASQFANVPLAVEQNNKSLSDPKAKRNNGLEICPECSFLSEGVIYNLEAFTKDTLMLRALPHNKLILVRVGNAP